jgi:2-polyprenyl-6-methoxyphenol hydroxylase-like FAD-dependent oxidoreductase
MFAYLLARQGVQVTVLEKHKDFFRDFRGDTVHPSTLDVLNELGLLREFLLLPHERVEQVGIMVGDTYLKAADFRHVPSVCKFVALMPQWDFLNFLVSNARTLPSFQLHMEHEVTGLLREDGHIVGAIARHQDREVHIRSTLVIGCDGRHSVTRSAAGLELIETGVPIDVLWFRISRHSGDPCDVLGNVNYGKALILINRSDYFQAGVIIRKGSYDEVRARGLQGFRESIRRIVPFLGDRVDELRDWDQIKILTVQINRLRRWHRPGLLCIGDAAHAMSPAGGVGINLAIQDAVAAANILVNPLLQNRVGESVLASVQRRREFPARATQAAQVLIHRQFDRVFDHPEPIQAPWQAKAITNIPGIQRVLGYAVGVGVRPEHVRPPKALPSQRRCSSARKAIACIGISAAGIAGIALGWAAWKISRENQPGW